MNRENNRNFLEGKKYNIITFGCQMNERDSEKLKGILKAAGYELTESEKADVVLYNTCTVRENADTRVFGRLGYLNTIKKKNKEIKGFDCSREQ